MHGNNTDTSTRNQVLMVSHPKKYMFYISMGNFLENYDFALYIHFAAILSYLFFPPYFNPDDSIIFGFCMTLICSLCGTLIWGYIADTRGRRVPLIWSCMISAVVFFLIPIQGIFLERTLYSAFLFCLLRGIADFALTGEYLSSNIYIAESYSKSQTAYYSGLLDLVCNLGVVASLVISFISLRFLPQKIYEVPSWTFPFFIGSIVALVGYQTRKKVKESLDYTILKYSSEEKIVSIKEIYLYYKHNILRIVGIELLFGFGFVFVYVFCVKLLVEAKMSPSEILLNNAIVALIQGLSSYMWGWLAYDYDPIKITKMRSYLLLIWILSLGICFSSFITSPVEIFVCQCFSVILGVDHIPSIGVLLKGLPIQARSRTFNKAFFIGKTVMYILTSFVIYKLSDMFGFNIIFYAWLIIGVIFSYCIHTYIQYENIPFENKMRFLH